VRVVPNEAKKEIKGGRLSGFTDINPMWRIKTLILRRYHRRNRRHQSF
jgi:hypothetical protein